MEELHFKNSDAKTLLLMELATTSLGPCWIWISKAIKCRLYVQIKLYWHWGQGWDLGEQRHFICVLCYCCIDGVCSNMYMSVYAVSI